MSATGGIPVPLGPFVGGINNRTDDSTIGDEDVIDAVNWVMGIDGTLIGRQPIWEQNEPASWPVTSDRLRLLGYTVLHTAGVFVNVLIASNDDGTWVLMNGVWDKISNKEYRAFTVYGLTDNKVFFPAYGSEPGGMWQAADGSVNTVADTPLGYTACSHKDRVWFAGDLDDEVSTLRYSVPGPVGENDDWDQVPDDITNTNPAGFVKINVGDGQAIQYIMAYEDNVVIFKDDSTYIYAYDGNVGRGNVVQVSNNIGASGPDCVTTYKGIAYVYHEGNVYAFGGGQFQQITEKFLPMGDSSTVGNFSDPLMLSTFGDNLILRQYDKIYVYHFLTGSWTEWETEFPIGKFVLSPTNIGQENNTYFIQSVVLDEPHMYRINTMWDTHTEDFECYVKTKTYDFGDSYQYKRLFWWGIDCEAGNGIVTAEVTPFNNTFQASWEDMVGNWEDYILMTWESPLTTQPSLVDTPIGPASSLKRRTYKCLKSLRFHQLNLQVTITSDGTALTGRTKLFALLPFVRVKEHVVAKIT